MLVLVRGVSGSGKSTLGRLLSLLGFIHLEADQYFTNDDGDYSFYPNELPNAHEWCQNTTRKELALGRNVVVTNTFTRLWEMKPYLDMAAQLNIPVQVITMTSRFENIHGVPLLQVQRMEERWEDFEGEIFYPHV